MCLPISTHSKQHFLDRCQYSSHLYNYFKNEIGLDVINIFKKLNRNISAHYSSNVKILKKIKYNKLKLVHCNFSDINSNFDKDIMKKFPDNYDSIINLVGYIDNKSFKNFDWIVV